MLNLIHISDTHGPRCHTKVKIPKCDILVHSGDIGGRTTLLELVEFLIWFESQPAEVKIFCAGNHDLILCPEWIDRQKRVNPIIGEIVEKQHQEAFDKINTFNVVYLNNSGFEYKGLKFWGSPITPSFNRQYWAFNAERGEEIKEYWKNIPQDTDILITHGPPHKILDMTVKKNHVGCKDLLSRINELKDLKLNLFGHIHEDVGEYEAKGIIYSNGCLLDEEYRYVHNQRSFTINETTKTIISNE